MKKSYLFSILLLNMLIVFATNASDHSVIFNTIDLELTANSPALNPDIFTSTTASFTLTNNSSEFASNIVVAIPVPDGFVLTGSNPFNLTGGDYSSYFGEWELNNLAPGASETLTLNIYILTENSVNLYGEVTSADESDVDSTPDNGTLLIPVEDDEAVLNFNRVPVTALPDLTVDQLVVPNSISLGVVTDIQYRLRNIGEVTAFGPFSANFFYSTDDQLSPDDQQIGKKNYNSVIAGTNSIETDDMVILGSYGITPGPGFIIVKVDNSDLVTESDENNNVTGAEQILVKSIIISGNIDLELSLNQANIAPDQYSTYAVQLSLFNNNETRTATNVQVSVPRPNGLVYSGSNLPTANVGNFNTVTNVYSIASLAPGATAELTLNYFLLNEQAPVIYAQVTNANQTDSDSTPNNGTPPMPNEDDEATTATVNPPGDLPDLVINEVSIPATINRAVSTIFSYRLQNLGTAEAEGSFDVYYYYSSDDELNLGDQQIGQRTFEDFPAGAFSDELSAVNILSSFDIPDGPGYIIIKADNGNSILESNEENNIVVTAIEVIPLSVAPECATNLSFGELNCISDTPEGGKEIYHTIRDQGNGTTQGFVNELDENGNLIRSEGLGIVQSAISYTVSGNILRRIENGTIVDSQPLPAIITDNYALVFGATLFNDGFMLFAYTDGFATQFPTYSGFTAILTDENLIPIAENLISSETNVTTPQSFGTYQIAPDQVVLLKQTYGFNLNNSGMSLWVVNEDLEVLSTTSIASGRSTSAILKKTICGDYKLSGFSSENCGGDCITAFSKYGSFVNSEFVTKRGQESYKQTSRGVGNSQTQWSLETVDGGEILATVSKTFPIAGPTDNQLTIEKLLNGSVVSSQTIEFTGSPLQFMEISGSIYFVVSDGPNGLLRYYDVDCLEDIIPPAIGVDLELTSELTVTAPDIYSNYSVIYTLVNNGTEICTGIEIDFALPAGTVYRGSNPFSISRGSMSPYNNLYTLNELPAGETAVIELNYFSLSNGPIAHYAEIALCNEPDIDSTPGNGTPISVNEDDETAVSTELIASTYSAHASSESITSDRLEILKLYPNPIMDQNIRMALTTPTEATQTLLVFNELGIEVLRKTIDLDKGFNEIILPTKNLTTGMYRVLLPGNHARFGSASFMVIK